MENKNAYTPLEYIESSGTQYIDTRFKPNNNIRVIMDFEPLFNASTDGTYAYFGTRDVSIKNEYFTCIKS